MISVTEARDYIINAAKTLRTEEIKVQDAAGRIAAEDMTALRTQPPFDASAMDGYAVRSEDAKMGATLKVVGEAPAGKPYDGEVGAGEALRIFTGGLIPDGADHIIIQEDVEKHCQKQGSEITVMYKQNPPRHIRRAGIDFEFGDALYEIGHKLGALHTSVMAAAGIETIKVYRRPRVAIFSNGDELTEIGAPAKRASIISSTPTALGAWLTEWGADVEYLGIARDNHRSLKYKLDRSKEYDVVVPLGGASVGDYDLVKEAFEKEGYNPIFSKIAVRPGKPTWFGKLEKTHVLGLPGNPASGLVCAQVFLRPLIEALAGLSPSPYIPTQKAILTEPLKSTGPRALFSRAFVEIDQEARLTATPFPRQDSSLLTPFANANCFIFQDGNTDALDAGDLCDVMIWDSLVVNSR